MVACRTKQKKVTLITDIHTLNTFVSIREINMKNKYYVSLFYFLSFYFKFFTPKLIYTLFHIKSILIDSSSRSLMI